MTITELKPLSQERFIVKFDDGTELRATLSAATDLNLYSGRSLTDAEFEAVKAAAELSGCKERAMRIIGTRAMSKKELYNKLVQKGELAENAEYSVNWLEELRLLDDEAYAGMVVRHYAAKGFGRRRIQNELFRRGVPRDFWDEALDAMPEQDDKIDRLLRQKLRSGEPDRAELKKATDSLARRGFSWSEISAAVERFRNEENYYE